MAQSITLQNLADTAIVNNDILGQLCFAAPNEAGGTDSILIAASIFARSEGTFAADNNATELVFTTGASASAAPGATNYDMTLSSAGLLTLTGNLVIPDAGNIGSASDTNAIAIASDGVVTMDQIPVFSAGINVSGGTIAGTLATAAQGNITSLGTLTTLTVDSIIINGTTIGHTSDTDAITIAAEGDVTFSKAIKPAAPAAASGTSGIVVLDCNTTNHFTITTGGNITGWNFTNATPGQRIIVRVTNGASHTVAFSATGDGDVVYFPGGTEPTLTTSGGIDVYGFLCVAADTFDGFVLGQDIKA